MIMTFIPGPGTLLDESRLKPFIETIATLVHKDGFDPQYLLPSDSEEGAENDAVNQITSDVAEFDNWYFDSVDEDGYLDPRRDRLNDLLTNSAAANLSKYQDLADQVTKTVEFNLESMREAGDLVTEPNVEAVVNDLVTYIVNWQDWYYDSKVEADQENWFYDMGINGDIYLESDYGDPETSQGVDDLYDDENAPFPETVYDGEPIVGTGFIGLRGE